MCGGAEGAVHCSALQFFGPVAVELQFTGPVAVELQCTAVHSSAVHWSASLIYMVNTIIIISSIMYVLAIAIYSQL